MSKRMCDVNPEVPADFAYRWSWGDTGYCSAAARPRLEQLATNLSRTIEFSQLTPEQAPPLERPERAQLKGQIYALEFECAELQRARTSLLSELDTVKADNRGLRLSLDHSKNVVSQQTEVIERLQLEVDRLSSEVRNAAAELAFVKSEVRHEDVARLVSENGVLEVEKAGLLAQVGVLTQRVDELLVELEARKPGSQNANAPGKPGKDDNVIG